jgi:hypothetical protein
MTWSSTTIDEPRGAVDDTPGIRAAFDEELWCTKPWLGASIAQGVTGVILFGMFAGAARAEERGAPARVTWTITGIAVTGTVAAVIWCAMPLLWLHRDPVLRQMGGGCANPRSLDGRRPVPLSGVYYEFERTPLDAPRAAAELGVCFESWTLGVEQLEPRLAALRSPAARIDRGSFGELFAGAQCQLTVGARAAAQGLHEMSSTDITGSCCSCNGTKKFARSAWSTSTYICR